MTVSAANSFRLAFGSNFKDDFVTDDLKIVSSIGNKVPDVFVWLGDIHEDSSTSQQASDWDQQLQSDSEVRAVDPSSQHLTANRDTQSTPNWRLSQAAEKQSAEPH